MISQQREKEEHVAVYGDGEVASHLSAESPASGLLDRASGDEYPLIHKNAANSSI
jgi:hypothetical protein